MGEKQLFITFIGMGLVTYIPRALPLIGLSRIALPKALLTWLSMVPAAVLAALAAQSLVECSPYGLSVKPLEAFVSIPCLALAVRYRSMMLVSIAGMALIVIGRNLGWGA